MKILFVMRNLMYLRNYESTIRLLAERGHHVHVGYAGDPNGKASDNKLLLPRRLSEEFANVTFGPVPWREDVRFHFLRRTRALRDYLRSLDPAHAPAGELRNRARKYVRWIALVPGFLLGERGRRMLSSLAE